MQNFHYQVPEILKADPELQGAIARASATVDNIRWFEVLETRGHVEGGKVSHYQVTIKVGFTVNG